MLTRLGKNARLLCSDELNVKYSLVADENFAERTFFGKDIDDGFVPSYIVSTDLAAPGIMGAISSVYADKINLCIDHHAVNTLEADLKLVVPSASAAGEVVLDIAREAEIISGKKIIDKPLADALFCAIMSDSGSFRYSNTTEKTFEAAAFLKHCGAEHCGDFRGFVREQIPGELQILRQGHCKHTYVLRRTACRVAHYADRNG